MLADCPILIEDEIEGLSVPIVPLEQDSNVIDTTELIDLTINNLSSKEFVKDDSGTSSMDFGTTNENQAPNQRDTENSIEMLTKSSNEIENTENKLSNNVVCVRIYLSIQKHVQLTLEMIFLYGLKQR